MRNGVAVDSDPPDRAFHRLEVQDDDAATTYSYFSTWSSNYTASNLPGPGRILGNLYDWAGSTLWRRSRPSTDTNTQPGVHEETLGHHDSRELALPLPYFIQDDHDTTHNTAHSYFSTWSTNYTISNLPGPGRVIGNLFSMAGSSLERHLGQIAYRAGVGSYAKAETNFSHIGLFYLKMQKGSNSEEICELLLHYARSDNPAIQFMAFQQIVGYVSNSPGRRLIFEACFQRRKEPIEAATFSWKRPGVEHSAGWLHMYNLATLCLLTQANPVMDALAQLALLRNPHIPYLGFAQFEDVLLCCKNVSDDSLALRFLARSWNGRGFEAYVEANGYNDLVLRLTGSIHTPYEVVSSDTSSFGEGCSAESFTSIVAMDFTRAMWASLRALGPARCDEISRDGAQMLVWAEFFKLYCILRSRVGLLLSPGAVKLRSGTWTEECHRALPGPEHDVVRERLLELEQIHGATVRQRFPPEDPAVIAETLSKIPSM